MSDLHAPPRRTFEPLRKVGVFFGIVEMTIGALTMLSILVFVFLQALQRYLPIEQFAWTGEVARFSMVWLTFVVLGLLVTLRGHIALEIADTLPLMWVRIVQVFALVVVSATGVGLAIEALALISTQGIIKSPVLRIPMSWVYVPLLLGAVSTALRAAAAAVDVAVNGPVFTETEEIQKEVAGA